MFSIHNHNDLEPPVLTSSITYQGKNRVRPRSFSQVWAQACFQTGPGTNGSCCFTQSWSLAFRPADGIVRLHRNEIRSQTLTPGYTRMKSGHRRKSLLLLNINQPTQDHKKFITIDCKINLFKSTFGYTRMCTLTFHASSFCKTRNILSSSKIVKKDTSSMPTLVSLIVLERYATTQLPFAQ
jgi:hypothetical protein